MNLDYKSSFERERERWGKLEERQQDEGKKGKKKGRTVVKVLQLKK